MLLHKHSSLYVHVGKHHSHISFDERINNALLKAIIYPEAHTVGLASLHAFRGAKEICLFRL